MTWLNNHQESYERIREGLTKASLWPGPGSTVFIGGSLANGWHHAASDVDLYIISSNQEPWPYTSRISTSNGSVDIAWTVVDGVVCDVKRWHPDHIQTLLNGFTETPIRALRALDNLAEDERALLERLPSGIALLGAGSLVAWKATLSKSSFGIAQVTRKLDMMDSALEDSLAMLAAGDSRSAVLTARWALDFLIDGLLASDGDYGSAVKWRARRLLRASPVTISSDELWQLQSFSTYNDAEPGEFVLRLVERCRSLAIGILSL